LRDLLKKLRVISFKEEILSKESKIVDLNFEASLKELEEIVERLENGQGSLEDAISAYERGSLLKKHCQAKLDEARLKVEKIRLPQGDSAVEITDFDD
tara:strand:- start:81 stop:374 length:294 start_codon:yes stop_codon:yes gene_type:complete